MSTKTSETEERIDERTRRAAVESMTIVTVGDGEYKVYSGVKNAYVVNLVRETCDCPDEEYNHPADECKHRRRVEMEIGQREIPDLGPRRLDVELATEARNRRHESKTETESETVATGRRGRRAQRRPTGRL